MYVQSTHTYLFVCVCLCLHTPRCIYIMYLCSFAFVVVLTAVHEWRSYTCMFRCCILGAETDCDDEVSMQQFLLCFLFYFFVCVCVCVWACLCVCVLWGWVLQGCLRAGGLVGVFVDFQSWLQWLFHFGVLCPWPLKRRTYCFHDRFSRIPCRTKPRPE